MTVIAAMTLFLELGMQIGQNQIDPHPGHFFISLTFGSPGRQYDIIR
jgi:hypothetical protein